MGSSVMCEKRCCAGDRDAGHDRQLRLRLAWREGHCRAAASGELRAILRSCPEPYHRHAIVRLAPGAGRCRNRTVFFVSDGTGITAETFGNSILAQFAIKPRHVRRPFIDTADKAHQVVREINHTAEHDRQAADRLRHAGQPEIAARVVKRALRRPRAGHVQHLRRAARRPSSASSPTTASAASPTSPRARSTRPHRGDQLLRSPTTTASRPRPREGRRDPGRRQPQRQDADLALPGDAARHQGGQLSADPRGLRARPAAVDAGTAQGASASA